MTNDNDFAEMVEFAGGILKVHVSKLSNRGKEFISFATYNVLKHIETYTVNQYGDAPDDQAENWTYEQCIEQITRYANRAKTNQRPGESLRDTWKITHYACLAHSKMKKDGVVLNPLSQFSTEKLMEEIKLREAK